MLRSGPRPQVRRQPPPLGALPRVIFVLFALHVAEELPAFPAWATRHFGTTTRGWYVLSHMPLMAAVVYVVGRAAAPAAEPRWLWGAVMIQSALATNALFHLVTTVIFREYSPGVVTAVALYLPFTGYLLYRVRSDGRLRALQIAAACLAGAVIAALVTASLWLRIDFI